MRHGLEHKFSQHHYLKNLNSLLKDNILLYQKEFKGICLLLSLITSKYELSSDLIKELLELGTESKSSEDKDQKPLLQSVIQEMDDYAKKSLKTKDIFFENIESSQIPFSLLVDEKKNNLFPKVKKIDLEFIKNIFEITSQFLLFLLFDDFTTHVVLISNKKDNYCFFDSNEKLFTTPSLSELVENIEKCLSSANNFGFINVENLKKFLSGEDPSKDDLASIDNITLPVNLEGSKLSLWKAPETSSEEESSEFLSTEDRSKDDLASIDNITLSVNLEGSKSSLWKTPETSSEEESPEQDPPLSDCIYTFLFN